MERKYLLTIEETSMVADADTGDATLYFEVSVDDVTGVKKELGRYMKEELILIIKGMKSL